MPAALISLDAIRWSGDWKRWVTLASDLPPHLSPEFFVVNQPLVKGDELLVAEAWSSLDMLGALPLALTGDTLRAMRSDHSPSFDYCGTPAGIDAIWDCLRQDTRWNELVLDGVPTDSALARRLPELAQRDRYPITVRPNGRHLYLPLTGFEAAMNAKFRTNVQRCARKAGDLVLERIRVPEPADLEEAFAIEAMGWKRAAGTAITTDPRIGHLYAVLARLFGRRGRASLYFLRVAGRRVAMMFGLEDRQTLFALKIGYDPSYANLSPGHLLTWKVAADAEQRGLLELDFVGHEDEWKHKWTDHAHELSILVVYQRSVRGLTRYGLREIVKPRLPATVRETPHSPLPRRCQRADRIGVHTFVEQVRGRLDGGLGIKSGLRRALRRSSRERLGTSSRYPVGSWVRVLDKERLAATLDDAGRMRGLTFVAAQWETCGKPYKVAGHVRRIRDDKGRFRPVGETVLLEGVDCGGTSHEPSGCGRHCPLMYRDAWLEPTTAPRAEPVDRSSRARYARIKNLDEIYAGLDAFGRRDGLTFMPQMAAFVGKRAAIANELTTVFEYDRWVPTRHPVYILRGLHCDGSVVGARGPCERACALMWHRDWVVIEPEVPA